MHIKVCLNWCILLKGEEEYVSTHSTKCFRSKEKGFQQLDLISFFLNIINKLNYIYFDISPYERATLKTASLNVGIVLEDNWGGCFAIIYGIVSSPYWEKHFSWRIFLRRWDSILFAATTATVGSNYLIFASNRYSSSLFSSLAFVESWSSFFVK